jgi:ABC-type sugar transport system ATPase subunit
MATLAATKPVLETRSLSKSFNGVRVVKDVDLRLEAGRVYALVGHNGCGKSTIIKMLSGFHRPDAGSELLFDGSPLSGVGSRAEGRVAFVHQDLALVDTNSVLENFSMGTGYGAPLLAPIPWRTVRARARAVIEEFHIRARPETPVSRLSPADRTLLAIGRAISGLDDTERSLLVLDEATSTLTEEDVGRILPQVRRIAARGTTVIFVSHRLEEVIEVSDQVIVMRDGRVVAERPTAGLDQDGLIELILGETLAEAVPTTPRGALGDVRLRARGISGGELKDFSLELRSGEVVGVTGLVGSGKTDVGRLLFGAEPLKEGSIEVDGKPVRMRSPGDAIRHKIGYIPPDRHREGAVMDMTASENLTLPSFPQFWRGGLMRKRAERAESKDWMGRTSVLPPVPERPISTFSGGNQQKIIFARWLRLEPRILILDEPTQGVDVGATSELYGLLESAAADGLAVLVLSSEWDDLARICHRVIVLNRGRTIAELQASDLTHERITATALGASDNEETGK